MASRSGVLAGSAVRHAVPRMPFVLLVLGLLGGSLICLLVINTTLGAASFRISQLQKANASMSTQEQSLRQQVAAEEAPDAIARRAYQLGMRTLDRTTILDLRTHQTYVLFGHAGVGVELGAPLASPAASPAPGASKKPTGKKPAANAASPGAAGPAATASPNASATPSPGPTPTPAGSSR